MECNKDEAIRAKEIAEKKFAAKDIAGAKKFAVKAQNIFPGLDGIHQMISTLDVYISGENKINGESDWYGILNVKPQADDDTVRKHYRKLALMLHPDKNKSIGAEGAFKLISEAWSLLSDKSKRGAYDQKRNGGPSVSPGVYGFQNFTKSTTVKTQKKTTRTVQSFAPTHKPKPNTFWTVCNRCKMQYEYLRVYLNHNLLCPNCHEPFMAVETAPPPMSASKSSTTWNFSQQQEKSASNQKKNDQWAPFSGSAGATTAAQAASIVQQTYQKVKREREVAQAATKREEALRRKKYSKRTGVSSSTSNGRVNANQMGVGSGGPGNYTTGRVNGINIPNSTSDISQLGIQSILMSKAKIEIQNKLNEWKLASAVKVIGDVNGKGNAISKEKESVQLSENGDKFDQNKSSNPVGIKSEDQDIRSAPFDSGCNTDSLKTISINVPDSDFHDFDKDRTEMSFQDNQVWAAYDDDDGMPRYYALIHNVLSQNPFKMRISWLNSKTNSELGPLNWVGSGFAKTCGDFRVGRYEISVSLNSFSHKVRWTKGTRGVICIFPRKGEVWALYRNWSPDWNELTSDELIHKYDMVEVIEDYIEAVGVIVTPLVKVAGFKTVFHRHLDLQEVKRIPKEEMFRFSHHVPSYLLTGQEALNAPKGCRELDPAATPFELLQVIEDIKEEETEEISEISVTNVVDDSVEKTKGTVVVENAENTKDTVIVENAENTKDTVIVENAENTKDTVIVKNTEKTKDMVMVEISEEDEEEEISGTMKINPDVEIMNDANRSNL